MVGKTFFKKVAAECEMCAYLGALGAHGLVRESSEVGGGGHLRADSRRYIPLISLGLPSSLSPTVLDVSLQRCSFAEEQREPPAVAPMADQTFTSFARGRH